MSTPLPEFSPSCWPVDLTAPGADAVNPGALEAGAALAVARLRAATAYMVGGCPVVVRPCHRHTARGGVYYAVPPIYPGLGYAGLPLAGPCPTSRSAVVVLPGLAYEVSRVRVDGVVLAATAYRVDNGNLLVRQDGDMWPVCQDEALPAGAVGTFDVKYRPGVPPDGLASHMAGILAVEYARALSGQTCRLPANVVQVVRQGVSYAMGALTPGATGLPDVDAWVASVNPTRMVSLPVMVDPDEGLTYLTTWEATP